MPAQMPVAGLCIAIAIAFPGTVAGQIASPPDGGLLPPSLSGMQGVSPRLPCGGCDIDIEAAMRKWQGILDLSDKEEKEWPEAECGDGTKRKAPPYPPDDFYDNALCDPRVARDLVAALFQTMNSLNNQTIYSDFITVDTLEDEPSLPGPYYHDKASLFLELTLNEIYDETNVTVDNYCDVFQVLEDVVAELEYVDPDKLLDGSAGSTIHEQIVEGGCITTGGEEQCECFEDAETGYSAWYDQLAVLDYVSGGTYGDIGIREGYLYWENSEFCELPGGGNGTCWETLCIDHTRGLLEVDVSGYRGYGKTFVALKVHEQPSLTNDPPQPADMEFKEYGRYDGPAVWQRKLGFTAPVKLVGDAPDNGDYGWVTDEPLESIFVPFISQRPDDVVSSLSPCQSCTPGKVHSSLDGVHVAITLGSWDEGDAGYLLIRNDTITGWGDEVLQPGPVAGAGAKELASPDHIVRRMAHENTNGFDVVKENDSLRQILLPQALVDIPLSEVTANGYEIRFYKEGDFGDISKGEYPINPGAIPFQTIEITHSMSLAGGTVTGSLIIEESGQENRQTVYEQILGVTDWTTPIGGIIRSCG